MVLGPSADIGVGLLSGFSAPGLGGPANAAGGRRLGTCAYDSFFAALVLNLVCRFDDETDPAAEPGNSGGSMTFP